MAEQIPFTNNNKNEIQYIRISNKKCTKSKWEKLQAPDDKKSRFEWMEKQFLFLGRKTLHLIYKCNEMSIKVATLTSIFIKVGELTLEFIWLVIKDNILYGYIYVKCLKWANL